MMAARRKRTTGKLPEEKKTSKNVENEKIKEAKEPSDLLGSLDEPEESVGMTETVADFPFRVSDEKLPNTESRNVAKEKPGYQNRAPLQEDERARELLKSTLQHPISLTAEDLLNVSEPMRLELKKLLTKRRVEKKSVSLVNETSKIDGPWRNLSSTPKGINISTLPEATCEILEGEREGLTKGAVVIGDPILQYLSTLQPGDKPKLVSAAKESQALRAIYPLINKVGETECLLDSGSQIISMARHVAQQLEITWDPDIVIEMESANRSVEKTLGLARNVPFLCGSITVYLQVHIMANPAYKVLLGRPFDIVTESLVQNEKGGGQTLTLTDPNTGERCVMHTYERGKAPEVMKKAIKPDFRQISMKQSPTAER
jgi:hypothetical protein